MSAPSSSSFLRFLHRHRCGQLRDAQNDRHTVIDGFNAFLRDLLPFLPGQISAFSRTAEWRNGVTLMLQQSIQGDCERIKSTS